MLGRPTASGRSSMELLLRAKAAGCFANRVTSVAVIGCSQSGKTFAINKLLAAGVLRAKHLHEQQVQEQQLDSVEGLPDNYKSSYDIVCVDNWSKSSEVSNAAAEQVEDQAKKICAFRVEESECPNPAPVPLIGSVGQTGGHGSEVNVAHRLWSSTNRHQASWAYVGQEVIQGWFEDYVDKLQQGFWDDHPEVESRAHVLALVVQRGPEEDGEDLLAEEVKKYRQARRSRAAYEFPIHRDLSSVLGKAVCVYGFGPAHTVLAGVSALLSLTISSTLGTAVPLEELLPLLPPWLQPVLEQPQLHQALPSLLAATGVTVYHPGWMVEQGGALPGRYEIIEAVGHNDVDPLKRSAIISAHEAPHIMLWTNMVHNDDDIKSLVKTPALREAFRHWKEAQGQPGSAGRATRSGSRSVAVCLSWDQKGYKQTLDAKEGVAGTPYVNRLGLSLEVPQQQAQINKLQEEEFKKKKLSLGLVKNKVAGTAAEAAAFIEACVPVVAGTPLIGLTLERLLQLQRAPAWTANPQHLAAARAATGYLGFEQLLLCRPALVEAAEWLEAQASASQQEQAELQQGIDAAGKRADPLLGSHIADVAFLSLLQESGCLASKADQQLLAQPGTRSLVKGFQKARDQPGGEPGTTMQQPSKQWVGVYRKWVRKVVATATQQAAQQFMPAQPLDSSNSDDVQQPSQLDLLLRSVGNGRQDVASPDEWRLRQLQLVLSSNLESLKHCFQYQTKQLLLAWDEAGLTLSQAANLRIEGLLKVLLPEVRKVTREQAAVLVANSFLNPYSGSADAGALQQAGLTLYEASLKLFGSIGKLTCRPNLRLALRRLLFQDNVKEERQLGFLVSVLITGLDKVWDSSARAALQAVPEPQHGPEAPVQQRLQATYSRLQGVLQHLTVSLAQKTADDMERDLMSLLTSRTRHDSLISELHLFGSDYRGNPNQGCLPAKQEKPLTASHMRKARLHPILGAVEAIRFLAPPLLGEDKASATWRDVVQQLLQLLNAYNQVTSDLQQLAQGCCTAASGLLIEAAADAPETTGAGGADATSAAAAAAALNSTAPVPTAGDATGAAVAALINFAGAAASVHPAQAVVAAPVPSAAAAATATAATAAGDTATTTAVAEPDGVRAVGGGAGASEAAATTSDLQDLIEAWRARPRKCSGRDVFVRESDGWEDMFDKLAVKVQQQGKAEPGWTLEYVRQRLEATLVLIERSTMPGRQDTYYLMRRGDTVEMKNTLKELYAYLRSHGIPNPPPGDSGLEEAGNESGPSNGGGGDGGPSSGGAGTGGPTGRRWGRAGGPAGGDAGASSHKRPSSALGAALGAGCSSKVPRTEAAGAAALSAGAGVDTAMPDAPDLAAAAALEGSPMPAEAPAVAAATMPAAAAAEAPAVAAAAVAYAAAAPAPATPAAAGPSSAGKRRQRKPPVIINGAQLVAEGKLQLGQQVWRLGRDNADRSVDVIVEKDADGQVRFKLPDDKTRYKHISPLGKAAWNKAVASATEHPQTLTSWAKRKARESFEPREAFVPVQVTLGSGTVQYKRITEL